MPCKAMQKLSVRKGAMFWCAWLPPVLPTAWGARDVFDVVLKLLLPALAEKSLIGLLLLAAPELPEGICVWVGISLMLSV